MSSSSALSDIGDFLPEAKTLLVALEVVPGYTDIFLALKVSIASFKGMWLYRLALYLRLLGFSIPRSGHFTYFSKSISYTSSSYLTSFLKRDPSPRF